MSTRLLIWTQFGKKNCKKKTGQKLKIHEDILHNNFNFNEIIIVWDDFMLFLLVQISWKSRKEFGKCQFSYVLQLLWHFEFAIESCFTTHWTLSCGNICFCDVTRVVKSLAGAWKIWTFDAVQTNADFIKLPCYLNSCRVCPLARHGRTMKSGDKGMKLEESCTQTHSA